MKFYLGGIALLEGNVEETVNIQSIPIKHCKFHFQIKLVGCCIKQNFQITVHVNAVHLCVWKKKKKRILFTLLAMGQVNEAKRVQGP